MHKARLGQEIFMKGSTQTHKSGEGGKTQSNDHNGRGNKDQEVK